MEKQAGDMLKRSSVLEQVMERIDRRIAVTQASAKLSPEERQAITALGELTQFALSLGNPIAIPLGEELIKCTDSLMPNQSPSPEQK